MSHLSAVLRGLWQSDRARSWHGGIVAYVHRPASSMGEAERLTRAYRGNEGADARIDSARYTHGMLRGIPRYRLERRTMARIILELRTAEAIAARDTYAAMRDGPYPRTAEDSDRFYAAIGRMDDTLQAPCDRCGGEHGRLWTIERRPLAPLGHFGVVRLNGEPTVIDGSLPTRVDRLPRDARPVDPPSRPDGGTTITNPIRSAART